MAATAAERAGGVGSGSAWRRTDRQLRAFRRHELSVPMELAAALHQMEEPSEGEVRETCVASSTETEGTSPEDAASACLRWPAARCGSHGRLVVPSCGTRSRRMRRRMRRRRRKGKKIEERAKATFLAMKGVPYTGMLHSLEASSSSELGWRKRMKRRKKKLPKSGRRLLPLSARCLVRQWIHVHEEAFAYLDIFMQAPCF